ncbi:SRPBCC domain-containing protein [Streptomyces sp. NPDC010273]|uniref:SRPBCC domain-containing protein n=1 Tax=Streptomyces sp. NPDC010273 TaxID=3364829 RepID=UPI0036E243C7
MSKEFEIVYEFEVDATPDEVWDAVTSGTGGWLWPMEFDGEKRVGPFGSTLTNFEPPHRLTARTEDVGFPTQSLNQIDETIEPRDGGRRAWVRYVHSGIFTDDWDNQFDGASKHNAFYMHTLREYVTHFAGRPVAFATLNAPDASTAPDSLEVAARALGLTDDVSNGTRVQARGPEGQLLDAVVDFRDPYFIGLRTDTALIRFFGRNHWGAPVGVSVHDFAADADAETNELAWQSWLDGVFA